MTLSVAGGEHSWIAGDFPDFIRSNLRWRTRRGSIHLSFLHGFRKDGVLPSCSGGTLPAFMFEMSDDEMEALPTAKKLDLIERLRDHALPRFIIERQMAIDPGAMSTPQGMAETLKTVKCFLQAACDYAAAPGQIWGDCASPPTSNSTPAKVAT